jgi:hypothetical protein
MMMMIMIVYRKSYSAKTDTVIPTQPLPFTAAIFCPYRNFLRLILHLVSMETAQR